MRIKAFLCGLAAWLLAANVHAVGEVTGCGTETSNLKASKVLYVTPSAAASGSGTSFSSPMSFTAALNAVAAGQMILLQPGKYAVPYKAGAKNTITLSKSGTASAPIYMVAANCGKAVIDFSFPEKTYVQDSFGFALKGSHWYFKGIDVTRAGYQGVYVTGKYNTFENCAFYENRNTGLEINKGGAYTTVLNSDAYRNYDPKKSGSMADGFGPKQTQGPGNRFIGCRAWENSDDGFDLFDSPEVVTIESSWPSATASTSGMPRRLLAMAMASSSAAMPPSRATASPNRWPSATRARASIRTTTPVESPRSTTPRSRTASTSGSAVR